LLTGLFFFFSYIYAQGVLVCHFNFLPYFSLALVSGYTWPHEMHWEVFCTLWLSGKESTCNAGDLNVIRGSRRFPGEGIGYPHQYSCLENPMDRGRLQSMGSLIVIQVFIQFEQLWFFNWPYLMLIYFLSRHADGSIKFWDASASKFFLLL